MEKIALSGPREAREVEYRVMSKYDEFPLAYVGKREVAEQMSYEKNLREAFESGKAAVLRDFAEISDPIERRECMTKSTMACSLCQHRE